MSTGASKEIKGGAAHSPVSIVVVDDHRFMRELIITMLRRHEPKYRVVAEASDAAAALAACERVQPDLLILDINLPGESGIEIVAEVQRVSPKTRILLCTAGVTDERILDALRSGANGFVEKTNTWEDFIAAIECVTRGEHHFCARSSAALAHFSRSERKQRDEDVPQLSAREKEVLALVARGDSSKEIAAALGISVGTVDVHRAKLMKKLRVKNVAGLVLYAFERGLIRSLR